MSLGGLPQQGGPLNFWELFAGPDGDLAEYAGLVEAVCGPFTHNPMHLCSVVLSLGCCLQLTEGRPFFELRPNMTHATDSEQEHVQMWTVAIGNGAMMPTGTAVEGRYFDTFMKVPEWIYTQCAEKGDHFITSLETVAVILGVTTFQQVPQNAVVTAFNDNMMSLFSITKGTSGCPEINIVMSRLYLTMAELQVNFPCIQITSDSNVADGPSRNRVTTVDEYGTTHETPHLPRWLERLMQFHELPEGKTVQWHFSIRLDWKT